MPYGKIGGVIFLQSIYSGMIGIFIEHPIELCSDTGSIWLNYGDKRIFSFRMGYRILCSIAFALCNFSNVVSKEIGVGV